MTHEEFWRALDTLAAERGLSPSGLARAAGLDPTAFNRSKRIAADGTPRWPSTGSLARVLAATGTDLPGFAALVGGAPVLPSGLRAAGGRLRAVSLSRLGDPDLFDPSGRPADPGWDRIDPPLVPGPDHYAVLLDTDALAPDWRRGGLLLLDPGPTPAPGDRVLCWRTAGPTGAILLSAETIPAGPALPDAALVRVHRIAWARL